MDINIWIILEWIGALFALTGAAIMATRRAKPIIAWGLWIICNAIFIAYFIYHQQYGLLLMNIGGLFINAFGLYQWIQPKTQINHSITKLLLNLSIFFAVISIYHLILFVFSPSKEHIEWFGSMLNLTAAFLLASRHKYSFLCWFVWGVSNFTLLILTTITQQYGFAFLQAGFMVVNVYGSISWLKKFKSTHKIPPIEETNPNPTQT